MSNAARLADILKRLGDAHYQAADELIGLANEQPGRSERADAAGPVATPATTSASAAFDSAEFDDLPAMAEEAPAPKSRDDLFAECPDHQRPWTVKEGGISKNGKPYKAFWKCNGKNPDGTYCNKKPDPSWARAHSPEQALLRGAA